MAIVKLNVFHWHITDSQSFPLALESYPDFAKFGAYSPKKIYTSAIIKDVALHFIELIIAIINFSIFLDNTIC